MSKRREEDADLAGVRTALIRAARHACALAKMHGHPLVYSRNGKVVYMSPEEVLAELDACEVEEAQK